MYDKRYSLALKTGCFLLLLVALVVGVAGGAAACYLADQGAYTISREDMLEMGLQERCGAVADNVARAYAQETYGAAEEDLPGYLFAYAYDGHWQLYPQYYMGQSNYRYEIRDGAGNLLKSTYNGEGCLARLESVQTVSEILVDSPPYGDRLEETESSGIYWKAVDLTYTVTGYVLQDLAYDDQFSQYVSLVGNMYQYRFALVVLVCVCLAALLCLVVYLLSAAGHRPDRQGIALNPFDKLPGDLYLAAVIGGVTLLAMLFHRSFYWEGWITLVTGIACLLAAGILVTAFLMSLATRVKYGQGYWWRRSVIGFCLVLLLRACRFVVRGARSLFGMLPTIWKWLLIGGLAWIFTLACLNPYTTGMGALATACLWAFLIVYPAWSFGQLRKAARRMAEGKFQEKVPLDHLHGSFRQIAQDLNALGQGASLAVERQLRSERMKTELITNVSHDIKTPLTSIVSYVDLLKKQAMPNDQAREYLEVLDRQSARLKKLTEDLVEASKASTGNLTVDFQRTDVNVLLTQSAGEYQEKLAAKGMDLILTPAPENPAISADGRLLWRVFENLLSNIHKYAQPGTRVYLTCEAGENQVTITFRNISATPLNISADELMERFVRGDASRNTEGSGLGLSIARSLTQLQHGTFSLTIDGDLFKAALTFPRIP